MTERNTSSSPDTKDYADRDIRLGTLVIALVFTGLFTILTFIGMRLLLSGMKKAENRIDQPWSTKAGERQLPPAPLLQVTPLEELRENRARETALLTHYEWIDKNAGIVRIPVEHAIDLLATRGIPPSPVIELPGATNAPPSGAAPPATTASSEAAATTPDAAPAAPETPDAS